MTAEIRLVPVRLERLEALERVYAAALAVQAIGGQAQADRLAETVAYAKAIHAMLAELAALEEGNRR